MVFRALTTCIGARSGAFFAGRSLMANRARQRDSPVAVSRPPSHPSQRTTSAREFAGTVRARRARHVIETVSSSATVTLAAEAHGVEPAQIAKTICLRIGGQIILIVTSGTARLDNRKFKDRFGGKPRMLDADQVLASTSHPVGGVSPFGLLSPSPLPVYCDVSLRAFQEVVPAAGATNAAVRIGPEADRRAR